jgi:hypothetical protein
VSLISPSSSLLYPCFDLKDRFLFAHKLSFLYKVFKESNCTDQTS